MIDQGGPLVAALRSDDHAAFAEQVQHHRQALHVHCYRMLGSIDDAEDVVQETLLRAWRQRHRFEGHSSFRAWLYRIATNACIDSLRAGQASRAAASRRACKRAARAHASHSGATLAAAIPRSVSG